MQRIFFWFQVSVTRSVRDECSIEVILRCLAIEGDGIGPHEVSDGGILSTVLAAGFKGNDLQWLLVLVFVISSMVVVSQANFFKLPIPKVVTVCVLCNY